MRIQIILLTVGLIFVSLCVIGFLGTDTSSSATPTPLPNVTRIVVDGNECVIVVIAENTFGYGCKDQ